MMRRTVAALFGVALLAAAGCGEDDENADEEYCEVAEELAAEDDRPSDDLLDRYIEVAPDEIRDEAEVAVDAIKERGEEAFSDPEVLDAIEEIEETEAEECGIGRDDADEGEDTDTEDTTDDTTADDGADTGTETDAGTDTDTDDDADGTEETTTSVAVDATVDATVAP